MLPPLLEVHRSTRMPTCGPNHTLDRRHGVPADAGAEDTPAAIAGAPEEIVAAYSGYGLPLGEAFQLRDDVLGVFGDPEQTGKPAGDDLREGKRTVLIALAHQRADDAQRGHLRALLGDPGLDHSGVETLRSIIEDTGALASTETMIDELLDRSLASLDGAGLSDDAREVLTGLAYAATRRSV